jgi:hypothetical protein
MLRNAQFPVSSRLDFRSSHSAVDGAISSPCDLYHYRKPALIPRLPGPRSALAGHPTRAGRSPLRPYQVAPQPTAWRPRSSSSPAMAMGATAMAATVAMSESKRHIRWMYFSPATVWSSVVRTDLGLLCQGCSFVRMYLSLLFPRCSSGVSTFFTFLIMAMAVAYFFNIFGGSNAEEEYDEYVSA